MSSTLFSAFHSVVSAARSKPAIFALGIAVSVGLGSVIVKAADNPMIRETINQFNAPIRRAVQQYIPRATIELPRIFQSRERAARPMPANSQATLQNAPNSRSPLGFAQHNPALHETVSEPAPRPDIHRPRKSGRSEQGGTAGLASGTNYCVRLCDGFAFPIGNADNASKAGQEAACQLACPGAETALYSAPRGAKDLDAATRAGRPYTALPTAFRYRDTYDKACVCRGVGETQSPAALLTDFTLRRGDIAMSRIGMRHFDGSRNYPHRAAAFSDALRTLTDKREVALLRGMEAASLRGVLPTSAQASIRARVISEIQRSERTASAQPASGARASGGFESVPSRPAAMQPGQVRVVNQRVGLVAMN